jgi:hypothetical protein
VGHADMHSPPAAVEHGGCPTRVGSQQRSSDSQSVLSSQH